MKTKTIVYFKHGLGNLIMMSPAIRALASMDESGKVDICMSSEWNDSRRPAYDEYFDRWDIVEEVVNYPKQHLQKKYTRWFYTGHSEYSSAFEVFKKKNPVLADCPDWSDRTKHEMFWYMDALTTHGYKGKMFKQFVPLGDNEVFKGENNKLIGICNGTYSERMKTAKQWHYFQELVNVIKSYCPDSDIVKVGYQDELKDVEADIDYVGKLSFCETAKVISQMDLFITTDSACMHVGDALEIPMIALFGGTLVSKNGPVSKNAEVITLGLNCQPCQRTHPFYNCEHYHCMSKLSVGDVMAAVRRKLNGI